MLRITRTRKYSSTEQNTAFVNKFYSAHHILSQTDHQSSYTDPSFKHTSYKQAPMMSSTIRQPMTTQHQLRMMNSRILKRRRLRNWPPRGSLHSYLFLLLLIFDVIYQNIDLSFNINILNFWQIDFGKLARNLSMSIQN